MTSFWHTVEVILALFLLIGAGYLSGKKGILDAEGRKKFSSLLMTFFLPALILSQILPAFSQEHAKNWWLLLVVSILNLLVGLFLGIFPALLGGQKKDLRVSMASMAFVNSGYIPLSLLMIISLGGHFSSPEGDIASNGAAMVALYLVVFSPLLWLIGYNLIACDSFKNFNWRKSLTVPGVTALFAIVCALTPLKQLFLGHAAPLKFVFSAAKILGDAAAPCGLLLLGANLSHLSANTRISWRFLSLFAVFKYLIAPLTGVAIVFLCKKLGLILTPLLALVIILEGAMPPGLNLIIICQSTEKKLDFMSSLLFSCYLLAIPFIFLWLFLGQKIATTLFSS